MRAYVPSLHRSPRRQGQADRAADARRRLRAGLAGELRRHASPRLTMPDSIVETSCGAVTSSCWGRGTKRRPGRRSPPHPGGLQIGGGGIRPDNARSWLDAEASPRDRHLLGLPRKVSSTSSDSNGSSGWSGASGWCSTLSCRRRGDDYFVVSDQWRHFTRLASPTGILARSGRPLRRVPDPRRGRRGATVGDGPGVGGTACRAGWRSPRPTPAGPDPCRTWMR